MPQVKTRLTTEPSRQSGTTSTVLSICPIELDHAFLDQLLNDSDSPLCSGCKWTLLKASNLSGAIRILMGQDPISIVVCDSDSLPVAWRELAELLKILPDPPVLIVTSSKADERVWAAALKLGVYDMLVKPFDRKEVIRVLRLAWTDRNNSASESKALPQS